MAVTLTQLVAFLTVVRRGSVTGAAEELVVTQPSVSAAVSALERELGVRLTERASRTTRASGRCGSARSLPPGSTSCRS
jgi:DNA-binding transcriptional LysR family regulator